MEVKEIISSGILEEYVLGLTSEAENIQINSYLKLYPEIQVEIDQISEAIETYAESYSVTPAPHVKQQIIDRILLDENKTKLSSVKEATRNLTPVYRISAFLKFAAAACFFLFLASAFLNYILYHKYNKSKSEVASARQELESQKQVALDMDKEMSVVKNKMALPVVLNGTPRSPESVAKIFWMKNTGDVYVDPSNLPQLPSDKQYQLWAIVDSKPIDGGMIITKDGAIFHMQKMHSFGKAQAFAITIEKSGGSPTPTMSDMVVIAKI